MGSLDWPFNPLSLVIGAEATFVARSIDTDRAHLTQVLRAAANHRGSAFVEIFQNCNIYNDGAFDFVRDDKTNRIYLEHGKPVVFGEEGARGVRQRQDGSVEVVDTADESELLVHDTHAAEPSQAFALSRLTRESCGATPIGVFRDVERPVYDDLMGEQIQAAREQKEGDLGALLHAGDTWAIS
jgi:2-oxoglutarate ferredoxin oxidoreductase subunit beta